MIRLDFNGSDLSSVGTTRTTWATELRLFGCSGSLTYVGSLTLFFSEYGGDTIANFPTAAPTTHEPTHVPSSSHPSSRPSSAHPSSSRPSAPTSRPSSSYPTVLPSSLRPSSTHPSTVPSTSSPSTSTPSAPTWSPTSYPTYSWSLTSSPTNYFGTKPPPTLFPTYVSGPVLRVSFNVSQIVDNYDATFDKNYATSLSAFRETAAAESGLNSLSSVTVFYARSILSSQGRLQEIIGNSSSLFLYGISFLVGEGNSFVSPAEGYAVISSTLSASVESGNFQSVLRHNAKAAGSTALM